MPDGGSGEPVRLAELLVALSAATDLGMGQPAGHAARTCLLATGLAETLGADADTLAEVYYVGLLRYVGCTADAHELAAFAGDEIKLAVAVAPVAMGERREEAAALGVTGEARVEAVERVKTAAIGAHCEAAGMLAARLGLGPGVLAALRHGFERWDGAGHPAGLAGESVPLPTRIAVLARDVELWHRRGGLAAACEVATSRRGRAYDPTVVDAFLRSGQRLLAELPDSPWEWLLAAEPTAVPVAGPELDRMLEVVADFADVKLPYALGHSRTVARLAAAAALGLGLGEASATRLRRAGLLHDLGRCGVSSAIWDKPGPLSTDEWERVRLHPYLTERILARTDGLRVLATLAGSHHERLDGSGYHRGSAGSALGVEERILAAADAYAALRQDRPHRRAFTTSGTELELAADVGSGRLDGRAVAAVAAAAGRPMGRLPARWPAGLTDREIDVLRLACRGMSKQDVADRLFISAKTVGRHLENSYRKIGVSSRAGAALYAVAHGLLADSD